MYAKFDPKRFRIPEDVALHLDRQKNATEYVVEALREKMQREERERFRASARRIAAMPLGDRDVEFAMAAQSQVVGEG